MRFLVFSDSHGNLFDMKRTLERYHAEIQGVIHLGDGSEEFEVLSHTSAAQRLLFLSVCGNGEQARLIDSLCPPLTRVLDVEGVRILLTHGHAFGVYYGTQELAEEARNQGCTVALHGHTHIPHHTVDYGKNGDQSPIEILCPGSISSPRAGGKCCGFLDVKDGKVFAHYEEI